MPQELSLEEAQAVATQEWCDDFLPEALRRLVKVRNGLPGSVAWCARACRPADGPQACNRSCHCSCGCCSCHVGSPKLMCLPGGAR